MEETEEVQPKKKRTSRVLNHPVLERAMLIKKSNMPDFLTNVEGSREDVFNQWLVELRNCHNCILHRKRNNVAMPDGTLGAKVLIVTENPGFLEDLTGRIMVSPTVLKSTKCNHCMKVDKCYQDHLLPNLRTYKKYKQPFVQCEPKLADGDGERLQDFYLRSQGAILDGILNTINNGEFPRQSWIDYKFPNSGVISPWFFMSSVQCRPYDSTIQSDNVAPNIAIRECSDWLLTAWAILEPECCIAIGEVALSLFIGKEAAKKRAIPGQIFDTKWGQVIYIDSIKSALMERYKPVKGIRLAKIKKGFEQALEIIGEVVND